MFPNGLDTYNTPAASPSLSPQTSLEDIQNQGVSEAIASPARAGFFGRLFVYASAQPPIIQAAAPLTGPLEEMIVAGASFGL